MKFPTARQTEIHHEVCSHSASIKSMAQAYGISPATVRRDLDAVTEFNSQKIEQTLTGEQWRRIVGQLRNGNWSCCDLADQIEESIEGRSS